MNHSKKLGEYSAALRYEDLPAKVVEQTKKLTLQVLGASLACVHMEQAVH